MAYLVPTASDLPASWFDAPVCEPPVCCELETRYVFSPTNLAIVLALAIVGGWALGAGPRLRSNPVASRKRRGRPRSLRGYIPRAVVKRRARTARLRTRAGRKRRAAGLLGWRRRRRRRA
jgi:hypothetical protein